MKNHLILYFVLCLAIIVSPLLWGHQPISSKRHTNDQSRVETNTAASFKTIKSLVESLPKGPTFQTDSETYTFLPGLYSILDTATNSNQSGHQSQSANSSHTASPVLKQGPYAIFQATDHPPSAMATSSSQSGKKYPVSYNLRTGQLGIITGILVVEITDMDKAQRIADAYHIRIESDFAHLKQVFYSIPSTHDIVSKKNDLINDARVKNVSIEVVENFAKPY